MNEEEKLKDLKAVYSGAVQSGEIGIANMIKGGIDLIEKKNRTIQQLKDENRTLNRQAQQYFEQGIKKDKIIKNQSYTNKKMRNKLQGYRKLLKLKEKHLQKRDKQIEQYQNMLATNDMLHVLECEKKDKIIDLMGEKIFEEGIVWENKEDVKLYYERKVENG